MEGLILGTIWVVSNQLQDVRKLSPAGKRSFSLGQAKAEKWHGKNDEMKEIQRT